MAQIKRLKNAKAKAFRLMENGEDERWEIVKRTGVDFENEVVWGWTDHITLFGVMDEGGAQLDGGLGPVLILAFFLVAVVGVSAMLFYRRAKRKLRRELVEDRIKQITDQPKRKTRPSQLDLDILTREYEDED